MQSARVAKTKAVSLLAAAGALAAMGIVSVVAATSDSSSGSAPTVIADTTSVLTTPSIPSAAPSNKAQPFKGGDWNGM
ncbi:MAG TPA: hypothetical protein VFB19_06910 [Mycobacterium sp.]|nr:hypothetical protein [Mycobacterium sp.]